MSRSYARSARLAFEAGELAPARFQAIHSLELALKAALHATLGEMPRTHNVGGLFGQCFRERIGTSTTRQINRILSDYGADRYPDQELPDREQVERDLRYVEWVVEELVPGLAHG